jgi:undecaprenyl diphosphate synthase
MLASVTVCGDRAAFSIIAKMRRKAQTKIVRLVVATNYGNMVCAKPSKVTEKNLPGTENQEISEQVINQRLYPPICELTCLSGWAANSVLVICVMAAAYTELYFTATLWPDFDQNSLEDAIKSFKSRQRRFGHTGEQVLNKTFTLYFNRIIYEMLTSRYNCGNPKFLDCLGFKLPSEYFHWSWESPCCCWE